MTLKLFQVNVGSYLQLDQDIQPTARVGDLSAALEGIGGGDVILLTSDGQQMDPCEIIGKYSVGTESKPIFVFYRNLLLSSTPPCTPSHLTQKPEMEQLMKLVTQKPNTSHFQKQITFAKLMGEHTGQLSSVCNNLCEEYSLQLAGWQTVLYNCRNIISTYRKHQELFTKAVEKFNSAKPHYFELLDTFPSQIRLLQDLPIPSGAVDMTSSLYDWISTHDEKNSLLDLSSECQKALKQADEGHIQAALFTSEQILASAELCSLEEMPPDHWSNKLLGVAESVGDLAQLLIRLAQSIQTTSQRAMRSGDAGTIADLVVSHRQTLQLMQQHTSQLEGYVKQAEAAKDDLTRHIHKQLKVVTELQMKISESNSQLVFLHEHIKLAKKRFEVLDQVCSTPLVLSSVLSEIERRRAFLTALQQRVHDVSSQLRGAKETEKEQRKVFSSSHGHHFLLTLFPELQGRVPDTVCQLMQDGRDSHPLANLKELWDLLPQDLRSRPALVSQPAMQELVTSNEREWEAERTSLRHNLGNELDQGKAKVLLQLEQSKSRNDALLQEITTLKNTLKDCQIALSQAKEPNKQSTCTEEKWKLQQIEQCTSENSGLKQQVEQCTSENSGLKQQVEQCTRENSGLKQQVEQCMSENSGLKQQVEQCTSENSGLKQQVEQCTSENSGLKQQVEQCTSENSGLKHQVEQCTSENSGLKQQVEQCTSENSGLKQQVEQCMSENSGLKHQVEQCTSENSGLKQQVEQCTSENSGLKQQVEQCTRENSGLKQQVEQCTSENSGLKQQVEQCTSENSGLKQQVEQCTSENSGLKQQVEQCMSENSGLKQQVEQCTSENSGLKQQVEQCTSENSGLKQQVEQCTSENSGLKQQVEQCTSENSGLKQQVEQCMSEKVALQEKYELNERETECLKKQQKQESLINERLQVQCTAFADEQVRQESRYRQAQAAMANLRAQLDQAQTRVRSLEDQLVSSKQEELHQKLEVTVGEVMENTQAELVKAEGEKIRLEEESSELRRRVEQEFAQFKAEAEEEKGKLEGRLEEARMERESEVRRLVDEIRQLQEKSQSVERQLSEEKDQHMLQSMELEREVRELRRRTDDSPPPVAKSLPPVATHTLLEKISICNIQVGDLALFMRDEYKNYLAVSVDGKIYYLNNSCVPHFSQDLSEKVSQLHFKRKALLGRITSRVYVEVRKEGNRLGVQVGSRLYKVDAQEVTV